jgi:hypothetical protein
VIEVDKDMPVEELIQQIDCWPHPALY